jgi:hypothetical protein
MMGRIATKVGIYAGTLAWTNGYGRSAGRPGRPRGPSLRLRGGLRREQGPWALEQVRGGSTAASEGAQLFPQEAHSAAKDRARNLEQEIRYNYSGDDRAAH